MKKEHLKIIARFIKDESPNEPPDIDGYMGHYSLPNDVMDYLRKYYIDEEKWEWK